MEQDLYLSSDLSLVTSDSSCEKPISVPACDQSYYATLNTPTPPPRVRKSWLPPLKFQPPLETDHPALRGLLIPQMPARSQISLLPSPISPGQATRSFSHPSLSRSQTAETAASSIYSRGTYESTWTLPSSVFDSRSGTMSSLSLCSHPIGSGFSSRNNSALSKPKVPVIPEQYRHKSHSLRHGGAPIRPGSRPGMPPAEFWNTYVNVDEQERGASQHKRIETAWFDASSRIDLTTDHPGSPNKAGSVIQPSKYSTPLRKRADTAWTSVSSEQTLAVSPGKESVYEYSTVSHLPSPGKAILRPHINKANEKMIGRKLSSDMILAGGKRSYEHMRKQSQVVPKVDYGLLEGPGHKMKNSRTLVKQRQPWDPEPRQDNRKKASF